MNCENTVILNFLTPEPTIEQMNKLIAFIVVYKHIRKMN